MVFLPVRFLFGLCCKCFNKDLLVRSAILLTDLSQIVVQQVIKFNFHSNCWFSGMN
jgi:hypothetical protein